MLHGREVFIGFGDMEYVCTIFSSCKGMYPFMARCNATGLFVHGFTSSEARLLRSDNLPGCELL
jgi:hypothetical protein